MKKKTVGVTCVDSLELVRGLGEIGRTTEEVRVIL